MKDSEWRHRLAEYGLAGMPKRRELLNLSASELGQNCTSQCPQQCPSSGSSVESDRTLGDPLSIREVAKLIGCSPWSIRQRYLLQGLPHFRSGPHGKLIFYRNQVVAWLLRQQKGGIEE